MKKTGNIESIEVDLEVKRLGCNGGTHRRQQLCPAALAEARVNLLPRQGSRTRVPGQRTADNRRGADFAPDTCRAPCQRRSAQKGRGATASAGRTKPRHTSDTRTRHHAPGNAAVSVHTALSGF